MKKTIDNTDHCPNCHFSGRGEHGCGGNYTEIEKKCVICHPECERCKYGCLWAGMNNSGCPCKCHSKPMQMSAKKPITSKSTGISMQISVKDYKSMQNIVVCHGDYHPFGEKCKTCDRIKKQYMAMIKKALPTHNRNEVKKILYNL